MASLVFVYNANSGTLNSLLDSAHKLLHPASYNCALCALTHHSFGERQQWREFKSQTNMKFQFLHKDEFRLRYPAEILHPPSVYYCSENRLEVLISKVQLQEMKDLDALIELLNHRIDTRKNT